MEPRTVTVAVGSRRRSLRDYVRQGHRCGLNLHDIGYSRKTIVLQFPAPFVENLKGSCTTSTLTM